MLHPEVLPAETALLPFAASEETPLVRGRIPSAVDPDDGLWADLGL